MPLTFNIDPAGRVEQPTLVLAYQSGRKIGAFLDVQDLMFADDMKQAPSFMFRVNKRTCVLWHKLKDFRLIWVREWDKWYKIKVTVNENNTSIKTIFATHLPEEELSQINLHEIEINTEADIDRDDYDPNNPTILYNKDNPKTSLLHRITEKAVNFTIIHVDDSIAKLSRAFSFNKISLYDAFQEIAEEINCYFEFGSGTDSGTGEILRTISVYDLESTCRSCGYRGEFTKICPECGSRNIYEGYGRDTTIFFSTDNVLDDIVFESDTDSLKNCFRLEAGDDLMTSTIWLCNPNGSPYIWNIDIDDLEEDMSPSLVAKLRKYNSLYQEYYKTKNYSNLINATAFNTLIAKYPESGIEKIEGAITGYPKLMNVYFDTIDMSLYLESGLMPSIDIDMKETSAIDQAAMLTTPSTWSNGVSIQNLSTYLSETTIESAIEKIAKTIVGSRYKVTAITQNLNTINKTWTGTFNLENYSAPEDSYPTDEHPATAITISLNDNYETFLKQYIDMTLEQGNDTDYSITGLFKLSLAEFEARLKNYGLVSLNMYYDCCEGVLSILAAQGVATPGILSDNKDLYDTMYTPYYQKLSKIQEAIAEREQEIAVVTSFQEQIENLQTQVQDTLNFENYLKRDTAGNLTQTKLWKEFNSYRREDTYSNSNYISDGLSNAELFRNANEFLETAQKELKKASALQHSISSTVKNLLTIKEFRPLLKNFEIGNWLRIEVDGQVYKLRLLSYQIDFNDFANMQVTFADVTEINGDLSEVRQAIKSASSMATSYDYVQRQASQGETARNIVDGWTTRGLDATAVKIMNSADYQDTVFGSHGLLCRQINPLTGDYGPEQLKVVNSTLAITDDYWKTVKTAIGKFYYEDPITNELKLTYGINAETVVGKFILGENLGLYNSSASLKFDLNGLEITNGTNTFKVDPNSSTLFTISKSGTENILSLDTSGNLIINGSGTFNGSGSFSGTVTANYLYANEGGSIAGWNIDSTALYKGSSGFATFGSGNMYFGNNGLSISNTFTVAPDGSLTSTNANINGTITATSGTFNNVNIQTGTIGGFTIQSNYLANGTTSLAGSENSVYLGTNGISCGNRFKVTNQGIATIIDGGYQNGAYLKVQLSGNAERYSTISSDQIFTTFGNNNYTNITPGGLSIYSSDGSYNFVVNMGSNIIGTTASLSLNGNISCGGTLTIGAFSLAGATISNSTGCVIQNSSASVGLFASETRFRMADVYDGLLDLGGADKRWKKVYASSDTISTSDERDKDILGGFDNRHKELFMRLKPITFRWKNGTDDVIHYGLGAQSTEISAIECGITNKEIAAIEHNYWDEPSKDGRTDRYGMAYNEIQMLTIPVVQEHEYELQKHDLELKKVIEENTKLKQENAEIKVLIKELLAKIA